MERQCLPPELWRVSPGPSSAPGLWLIWRAAIFRNRQWAQRQWAQRLFLPLPRLSRWLQVSRWLQAGLQSGTRRERPPSNPEGPPDRNWEDWKTAGASPFPCRQSFSVPMWKFRQLLSTAQACLRPVQADGQQPLPYCLVYLCYSVYPHHPVQQSLLQQRKATRLDFPESS